MPRLQIPKGFGGAVGEDTITQPIDLPDPQRPQDPSTLQTLDSGLGPAQDFGGLGSEPATEEEQRMLEAIMDGIENQIHGKFRDDILSVMTSSPELWLGVASAAHTVLEGAFQKMVEQGVDPDPSLFFGQNGAIQNTVELVFELAEAAAVPGAEDSQQLDAAYFKVMQTIGEELYETDDISVAEAQELMMDLELGSGASDLAEEEFGIESDLGMIGAPPLSPEQSFRQNAEPIGTEVPADRRSLDQIIEQHMRGGR